MDDLIRRQDALDAFGLSEKTRKYGGDHSGYDPMMLYEIQDVIEGLPSVTPAQKIGRWIVKEKVIKATGCEYHETYGVCSRCGMRNYAGYLNYCPNCGARMREVGDTD